MTWALSLAHTHQHAAIYTCITCWVLISTFFPAIDANIVVGNRNRSTSSSSCSMTAGNVHRQTPFPHYRSGSSLLWSYAESCCRRPDISSSLLMTAWDCWYIVYQIYRWRQWRRTNSAQSLFMMAIAIGRYILESTQVYNTLLNYDREAAVEHAVGK